MSIQDRIKMFSSSSNSEPEIKNRSTTVITPPSQILTQKNKLIKVQSNQDTKRDKNEKNEENSKINKNYLKRASFITDKTREDDLDKVSKLKKSDDNWTDLDMEIDLFSSLKDISINLYFSQGSSSHFVLSSFKIYPISQ